MNSKSHQNESFSRPKITFPNSDSKYHLQNSTNRGGMNIQHCSQIIEKLIYQNFHPFQRPNDLFPGNAVAGETPVPFLGPSVDRESAQRRQLQAQTVGADERALAHQWPHRGRRRDEQIAGNELCPWMADHERRRHFHVNIPDSLMAFSRPGGAFSRKIFIQSGGSVFRTTAMRDLWWGKLVELVRQESLKEPPDTNIQIVYHDSDTNTEYVSSFFRLLFYPSHASSRGPFFTSWAISQAAFGVHLYSGEKRGKEIYPFTNLLKLTMSFENR